MPEIEKLQVKAPDGVGTVIRASGPSDGPGVLLVHGILHCSLIWKRQFADPSLAGVRLAAYDIRGHGAADKPAEADYYQPERFADELDAVINACGIDRPIIVGWSLGTRMAFNYLDKYGSDRVGGLLIVGARAKQAIRPGDTGQGAIKESCSVDLESRVAARLKFARSCYGGALSSEDFAEIAACAMLPPPEVLSHFAGRPMDYERLLSQLPIPVQAIYGEHDPVVPYDEVARIPVANPRAKLTIYQSVGHAPFFEQPQRFNADLLNFLQGRMS